MPYRFDWYSFIVPFGISEIFNITLHMNLDLRTEDLLLSDSLTPRIISLFSSPKNNLLFWEISHKNKDGTFTVTEAKIENQRLYFTKWSKPFLPRDPPAFSDLSKRHTWHSAPLEDCWNWVDDWHFAFCEGSTDENGWVYSRHFVTRNKKHPAKSALDMVRSRVLLRTRISDFCDITNVNYEQIMKPGGTNLVHKIQYGIRVALIKDPLDCDFDGRYYYFLTDSSGDEFQFQDYSSSTFRKIRKLYGINDTQYIRCIGQERLLGGEKNDAGKSGQIFWRSMNQEFVIKTVTHKEADFLQKSLMKYYDHLKDNPHTLISRIFGLYKVKIGSTRLRFIVMNNVFSTCVAAPQLIYDLKGTTEDRFVKQSSKLEKQPILKDLNFVDRYILVSKQMCSAILGQIARDVEFFQRIGVMDYSLLLGVCVDYDTVQLENQENVNWPNSQLVKSDVQNNQFLSKSSVFENGIAGALGETYYIGIIDMLQNWTKIKKTANTIKTVAFFDFKQNKIDSVAPKKYGQRFLDYLKLKICDASVLGESSSLGIEKIENKYLIHCESATDLKLADLFGFQCNPYVIIQYGQRQSVTQIVRHNDNPVWGHFCSFPVNNEKNGIIKFTVLSSELAFPPTMVGVATLSTTDLAENGIRKFSLKLYSEKNPRESKTKKKDQSPEEKGRLEIRVEKITFDIMEEDLSCSYITRKNV